MSPLFVGAWIALLAAATAVREAPKTALALDLQPMCILPPNIDSNKTDSSDKVMIFVHRDNSRYLEYGDDMSGTQTEVRCKGDMPPSCIKDFPAEGQEAPNCVEVDCPCDRDASALEASYAQQMMKVVVPMCQAAKDAESFRVLNIGLGGGLVPAYLFAHCPPNTRIDSVEYDERIVIAARRYFGTDDAGGRHTIETGDGGEAVAGRLRKGKHYDAVMVDAFDADGNVPPSCSDDTFFRNVDGLLNPSGKLVMQVWKRQYTDVDDRLGRHFGKDNVAGTDVKLGQFVIAATKTAENTKDPWALGLVQQRLRVQRRST